MEYEKTRHFIKNIFIWSSEMEWNFYLNFFGRKNLAKNDHDLEKLLKQKN